MNGRDLVDKLDNILTGIKEINFIGGQWNSFDGLVIYDITNPLAGYSKGICKMRCLRNGKPDLYMLRNMRVVEFYRDGNCRGTYYRGIPEDLYKVSILAKEYFGSDLESVTLGSDQLSIRLEGSKGSKVITGKIIDNHVKEILEKRGNEKWVKIYRRT